MEMEIEMEMCQVNGVAGRQSIDEMYMCGAWCRAALQSGLRQFGLVQKQPQPRGHKVIILFVVGGISAAEVRDVATVASDLQIPSGSPRGPSPKIILGGTSLLRPDLETLHVIAQ